MKPNVMKPMVCVIASSCFAAIGAGCSSSAPDTDGELVVFAAASLQSTFSELGSQFERDHPGSTVRFNFAGSSTLVAQLQQGSPGDVFASADTRNMAKAVDAGLIAGDPIDFAKNTLTIITPPITPWRIDSFADLVQPGIQVVVCAPPVPCGSATEEVEKATGVTLTPVSEESSVTDVLGKITTGQADAGLVYITDAATARDTVSSIPFPESRGAVNTYPIALLDDSTNHSAAQDFIDLVSGPPGQKILAAAGFTAP